MEGIAGLTLSPIRALPADAAPYGARCMMPDEIFLQFSCRYFMVRRTRIEEMVQF
jgi:hypothetical protein